jgi:hypothetical protein
MWNAERMAQSYTIAIALTATNNRQLTIETKGWYEHLAAILAKSMLVPHLPNKPVNPHYTPLRTKTTLTDDNKRYDPVELITRMKVVAQLIRTQKRQITLYEACKLMAVLLYPSLS